MPSLSCHYAGVTRGRGYEEGDKEHNTKNVKKDSKMERKKRPSSWTAGVSRNIKNRKRKRPSSSMLAMNKRFALVVITNWFTLEIEC